MKESKEETKLQAEVKTAMTLQEAKDQAAKEWNAAFDYRALRNGVQVGNISMLHLDAVNNRAAELYASQFKSSPLPAEGEKNNP